MTLADFGDDDMDDIGAAISAAIDGDEPAEPGVVAEEPPAEAAPVEIEPPPSSYPKDWHGDWPNFSPEWRQRLLQREQQAEAGITGYAQRLRESTEQQQQLQQWREQHQWAEGNQWVPKVVDDQFRAELAALGETPETALPQIITVWRALQNPATARDVVLQMCQRYGVTPEVMQQRYQPPTAADQEAGRLREIRMQEETRIREREAQETAAQERAAEERRNALLPAINQFFADHSDARQYQARMATLLKSGEAKTLDDAYDQARWSDPAARQKLIDEQTRAAQARTEREKADRLEKAKSQKQISGASTPTAGSSSPGKHETIEDAVAGAWDEVFG